MYRSVIIAGHQRSGTSILRKVIDSHPQVAITNEFGNFTLLDASYIDYSFFILNRWWNRRNYPFILSQRSKVKGVNMIGNLIFVVNYLSKINSIRQKRVEVKVIEDALCKVFREVKIVGDKYPDYIYRLDTLCNYESLCCICIFRDVRDVVLSTLEKARNEYRHWWPDEFQVAGNIAKSWVNTIERMEREKDNIYFIRYEDLVMDPLLISYKVGNWLDLDPERIDTHMIHHKSVGRYTQGLSKQELDDVIDIAGPTMERLGYNL